MARVDLDLSINSLVEDLSSIEPKSLVSYEIIEDEKYDSDVEFESSGNGKWQPKKWKMEYEKVVMYDLMGLKGYEIAEKMGYTPQHVYNILGCDEAIAITKALINRTRRDKGVDIAGNITEIQELTVKRLRDCLKDDTTFEESRLGFISKGIDVMKGVGDYLKAQPSTQINNQFTIPPSVADRFLEGLEKSDRARELLLTGREVAVVESND